MEGWSAGPAPGGRRKRAPWARLSAFAVSVFYAVALGACALAHRGDAARDAGGGDAPSDAAVDARFPPPLDAGVDAGPPDGGLDARVPGVLDCTDPELWARTPTHIGELARDTRFPGASSGLPFTRFAVGLAAGSAPPGPLPELCYRATHADPGSGWTAGEVRRSNGGWVGAPDPPGPVLEDVVAGPGLRLELEARWQSAEGWLFAAPAVRVDPPIPLEEWTSPEPAGSASYDPPPIPGGGVGSLGLEHVAGRTLAIPEPFGTVALPGTPRAARSYGDHLAVLTTNVNGLVVSKPLAPAVALMSASLPTTGVDEALVEARLAAGGAVCAECAVDPLVVAVGRTAWIVTLGTPTRVRRLAFEQTPDELVVGPGTLLVRTGSRIRGHSLDDGALLPGAIEGATALAAWLDQGASEALAFAVVEHAPGWIVRRGEGLEWTAAPAEDERAPPWPSLLALEAIAPVVALARVPRGDDGVHGIVVGFGAGGFAAGERSTSGEALFGARAAWLDVSRHGVAFGVPTPIVMAPEPVILHHAVRDADASR